MKKLGILKPGTIFTYANEQFAVLEKMQEGVFCILAQSREYSVFHTGKGETCNNYAKSTLRWHIECPWLGKLIDNGGSYDDLIPFDVDLRPTDQSHGYGELLGVVAAPLTLWQYGRYKDLIPFNEGGWWWLVTPWACPSMNCPDTNIANHTWVVGAKGNSNYHYCTNTYAARPALKLKHECLVSVEGEEDGAEVTGDGRAAEGILNEVDTMALIREVERRLSAGIEKALNIKGESAEKS